LHDLVQVGTGATPTSPAQFSFCLTAMVAARALGPTAGCSSGNRLPFTNSSRIGRRPRLPPPDNRRAGTRPVPKLRIGLDLPGGHQSPQAAGSFRRAQLPQSFGFDLADALARDVEFLA